MTEHARRGYKNKKDPTNGVQMALLGLSMDELHWFLVTTRAHCSIRCRRDVCRVMCGDEISPDPWTTCDLHGHTTFAASPHVRPHGKSDNKISFRMHSTSNKDKGQLEKIHGMCTVDFYHTTFEKSIFDHVRGGAYQASEQGLSFLTSDCAAGQGP